MARRYSKGNTKTESNGAGAALGSILFCIAAVGLIIESMASTPVLSAVVLIVIVMIIVAITMVPSSSNGYNPIGKITYNYELTEKEEKEYKQIIEAWEKLKDSEKVWVITSSTENDNPKYNSGAFENVERVDAQISKIPPQYLETNIETLTIRYGLRKDTFVILFDKFILCDENGIETENIEDVGISFSTIPFVESDDVPKDSVRVGQTWEHVNVNGKPDLRYKDNRKLPLMNYGTIDIESHNKKMHILLYVSNTKIVYELEELWKKMYGKEYRMKKMKEKANPTKT